LVGRTGDDENAPAARLKSGGLGRWRVSITEDIGPLAQTR
jgi:hypothetical protein